MAITITSLNEIVTTGASAIHTSTMTSTLTITPNPLTTAFEPPPYCTQSYLSNCQADPVSGTLPCFVSIYPQGVCDSNGQDCYPPIPGALDNSYVYSPGLSCPGGWTTAWQEVRTPGDDEETTAHCCPTGLTVTTYGIYSTWCEGTITQGDQTMIVNGLSECPSTTTAFTFGPGAAVDLTWVNADSTSVSVSGDAVFTISAEHIALLYKSTDLAAAAASVTPSSGNRGPSGTGSGSGLSAAATAGVAIGAAAVGVAAALALFYLCIRRREAENRRRGLQVGSGPGYTPESPHTQPPTAARGAVTAGVARVPTTGAEQELKADDDSPRVVARAAVGTPPVTELQGSAPAVFVGSGVWPRDVAAGFPQSTRGGGMMGAGMGVLGAEEVAVTNSYYQLPGTLEHEHGMLGHSRQVTPVDLIGRSYRGRG